MWGIYRYKTTQVEPAQPPKIERPIQPAPPVAQQEPAVRVNPNDFEWRTAVLPEEKLVLAHVLRGIRETNGDNVVLTEIQWGPHLLDRVVWPAARTPTDIVIKYDELDDRRPAKYLRFVYKANHKLEGREKYVDMLFIIVDGQITHQSKFRQNKGKNWTMPYLEARKNALNAR